VKISIAIEGMCGLYWPRWKRLVSVVEDLGFAGLFRSDHFTLGTAPDLDSLEMLVRPDIWPRTASASTSARLWRRSRFATRSCWRARPWPSTLPMVARYPGIWNVTGLSPEEFAERSGLLDQMLAGYKASHPTSSFHAQLRL